MFQIGIITFHCSYNYGSALQAFALQTFLNKLGFMNEIIDYRSEDYNQYRIIPVKLSKKAMTNTIRSLIFLPAYIKRRHVFSQFTKTKLNCTERTYYDWTELSALNKEFDCFVAGSDQIWNLDCTEGVNPAFFLAFASDSKKKISYAEVVN